MLYLIKREDGGVSLFEYTGDNIEDGIAKWESTSPSKVVSFREMDESEKPQSRNWRNAWVDAKDSISVNLEKARAAHKELMFSVCYSRLPLMTNGEPSPMEIANLDNEIKALNLDVAASLQDLYNTWLPEYDKRADDREYKMHSE